MYKIIQLIGAISSILSFIRDIIKRPPNGKRKTKDFRKGKKDVKKDLKYYKITIIILSITIFFYTIVPIIGIINRLIIDYLSTTPPRGGWVSGLEKGKIYYTDVENKIDMVKEWLTKPKTGFPDLVDKIKKAIEKIEEDAPGNPVPLDLIHNRYNKLIGQPENAVVTTHDPQKVCFAYLDAWFEKNGSDISIAERWLGIKYPTPTPPPPIPPIQTQPPPPSYSCESSEGGSIQIIPALNKCKIVATNGESVKDVNWVCGEIENSTSGFYNLIKCMEDLLQDEDITPHGNPVSLININKEYHRLDGQPENEVQTTHDKHKVENSYISAWNKANPNEFPASSIKNICITCSGKRVSPDTKLFFVEKYYTASGAMGDVGDLHFGGGSFTYKTFGRPPHEWEYKYSDVSGKQIKNPSPCKFAGVVWLSPPGAFGTACDGGYDLRGFRKIHWEARSTSETVNVEFFIGGINWNWTWDENQKKFVQMTSPYPDTMSRITLGTKKIYTTYTTLTDQWQQYTVSLDEEPENSFIRVVGGFGWIITWANNGIVPNDSNSGPKNPKEFRFEVRNIYYER